MFDDIEFDIKEYTIQGKMVIGEFDLSLNKLMHLTDAKAEHLIKEELANSLAKFILENKLAEFTMQEDNNNMSKRYRVRCFLTPDDQVRLIRTLYDKPVWLKKNGMKSSQDFYKATERTYPIRNTNPMYLIIW